MFARVTSLKAHERIHNPQDLIRCPAEGCERAFTTQSNLNAHTRAVHQPRQFCCPIEGCGALFAHNVSLKKHVVKHSEDGGVLRRQSSGVLDDVDKGEGLVVSE